MKFRHRSIMGLIYCCLLAIPMVSILSRVIYVQSNKNAKDSYYGETINQQQDILLNDKSELKYDTQYYIKSASFTKTSTTTNNLFFNVKDLTNITNGTNYGDGEIRLYYYINNNTNILQFVGNSGSSITLNVTSVNYSFIFNGYTNQTSNLDYWDIIYKIEYNKYSYLDNAFDYALSTFVDSNSWGNLDLFQWFTDLFLDLNAKNNALYIHFVNWYMNYVLFVSCAYILFLILMWFINYSRRILERGMNYDW